jgi:transcriptional regulator with XRE-family HTH domain
MKFSSQHTETALLVEVGARLEQARLRAGLSQQALAEAAGVAKRTVERFEAGKPGSLENLIRLLRALELVDRLELLLPEVTASPIEQLKLTRKKRQRAPSSKRAPRSRPPQGKWTWGDER